MTHVIASLAWCWMQVLIVAAAAIGLSLLILRRSPTAGATIALSGVVAALVLTGLALVPFPALNMHRMLGELVVRPSNIQQTAISKPKRESQTQQDATEESGFRAVLNRPLFTNLLKSLRSSQSPLMHWLRGQLLLAQELAADEMAAAAMGSKREYLQALARLALRQDSRTAGTPPTALVPVFSGFLLRRMVMLRAKDGSMHRNWRLLTQGIALGMVAAAALLSTAIRGLAEPPEKESDGSIRVAKATDAKLRPPTMAANEAGQAEFFKRPPFDIAKVAQKHGGFLIRLGEILQQPRFAKIAREDDPWWAKAWQGCFPGAAAPPFSLKDIEYIAGDFKLSTRYVTPPPEEKDPHPHQIMFGANTVCVRFHKPVDEIYAWLKRTPGAEENRHGDLPYVELMVPAIGPGKSCFCRVNDHTLLWVGGEGISLVKRLDQLTADSDPPAWNNTWKELERGLITAVAAEVEYKGPPEPIEDEWEKLNQQLFTTARLQAVGADWEPNEGGVVSFKLQFRFDTEGDARTIEAAVRHGLQKMVQESREAMANAENEKEKASAIAMIALLEQAQIETRQTENGWQIDVRLEGPIDIEANL